MKLTRMTGKCFLCGDVKGEFDTEFRVCNCKGLDEFPRTEHPLYVTILPDPGAYDVSALPSIDATKFVDLYAMSARAFDVDPSAVTPGQKKTTNPLSPMPIDISSERGTLPLYSPNHLYKQFGLTCGNPILYRVPRLEEWSGFTELYVLDMGTYLWSGTLKDPRSWAIINTALDNGITDLSLWQPVTLELVWQK